jgi:TolA-binding protein
MTRFYKLFFLTAFLLAVVACSTEKNTFVNRTYHGTTARYNGYFNANELIRQSMVSYRASLKEDYYELLPIEPLPNEEQVVGMYPAIDTAIAKCAKVIQKHSMPSNDKPSKKKEEHNPWIDENWITIGIAQYYRRDYDAAIKNFNFVKKFYSNDPSIYVGELWLAKTHIQIGKLTEAGFNLATIDKALAEQDSKEKPDKSSSKKGKKEAPPAQVPKKILFDIEKTKAELALRKGDKEAAIRHLKASLDHTRISGEKGRVHFVIAQLHESTGNNGEAKRHYTEVLKYNTPYEMNFNARLKRAFMGGDVKTENELKKMLRDAKNAEFKDQIYYALADIEMQKGNVPSTKEFLTKSAFYSTSNTRQKGMSYERLGNISYSERNYVSAQKYYDSCAQVIGDNYPNADAVRNKAIKLKDLVTAVETAHFEDSVQRIAKMSEDERVAYIEKVIKQIKEEEKQRKEAEARRLRELQASQNTFVQNTGAGSKWYFNNPKTRDAGFEEFRKLWGVRENEDDWRRSDRTSFAIAAVEEGDSLETAETVVKPDSLSVEMLLANIPLTDSALQQSTDRLLEALYTAGVIYKEQLNEPELARKQFNAVMNKELICDIDMSSAFQLYKMNEGSDASNVHKDHILNNYPNSDYANYLRDPNFFIKRKEMEALAVQEYVTILERYNRGLYYPVISKANFVIENEKQNPYRAKYMLLKAMCMGQMSNNKQELVPVLDQLIAEYPGSEEASKGQQMLAVIRDGYSANIEADFSKKSIYNYNDKAAQWVIIFLDKEENSNMAKTKVSDFSKEFFSRDKLKVSSKIYGDNQSIILVQEFTTDLKAKEFVRVFKSTRKHLLDLNKAKTLIITQENMKTLFETKTLAEYEIFFEENY